MLDDFKLNYDRLRDGEPSLTKAKFLEFWCSDTDDRDMAKIGEDVWRVFDIDKDDKMSVCCGDHLTAATYAFVALNFVCFAVCGSRLTNGTCSRPSRSTARQSTS